MAGESLADLRNLGAASAELLGKLGITTREDLAEWGAVKPYLALRAAGYAVSMNLVYAIEACLLDMHWTHLPREMRAQLQAEVARAAED